MMHMGDVCCVAYYMVIVYTPCYWRHGYLCTPHSDYRTDTNKNTRSFTHTQTRYHMHPTPHAHLLFERIPHREDFGSVMPVYSIALSTLFWTHWFTMCITSSWTTLLCVKSNMEEWLHIIWHRFVATWSTAQAPHLLHTHTAITAFTNSTTIFF